MIPAHRYSSTRASQYESFIIAAAGATQHIEGWTAWLLETSMKTISMMAMTSAIALLATRFAATPGAAKAGPPITLREYYCGHMMKAEQIAASQATRSARRQLRASVPNAMATAFAT